MNNYEALSDKILNDQDAFAWIVGHSEDALVRYTDYLDVDALTAALDQIQQVAKNRLGEWM